MRRYRNASRVEPRVMETLATQRASYTVMRLPKNRAVLPALKRDRRFGSGRGCSSWLVYVWVLRSGVALGSDIWTISVKGYGFGCENFTNNRFFASDGGNQSTMDRGLLHRNMRVFDVELSRRWYWFARRRTRKGIFSSFFLFFTPLVTSANGTRMSWKRNSSCCAILCHRLCSCCYVLESNFAWKWRPGWIDWWGRDCGRVQGLV